MTLATGDREVDKTSLVMGYDQIKKKINIQLIRWELLEKNLSR